MASLDDRRLAALLEDDSATESRAALDALRAGSAITFYDAKPQPASHFATIYRRRAQHVRRIGLDARGLDLAVERFELADAVGGLAIVHAADRDYSVFLAPDAERIVACVSVPAG